MTLELGRSLLLTDAVTPEKLGDALLLHAREGIAFVRALLQLKALSPERLDEELARVDVPVVRHVIPIPELVHQLPRGFCERMLAVPVRKDERNHTVDVAVVDARDAHTINELRYWLGVPLHIVRTSLAAMDGAIPKLKEITARHPSAPPIVVPSAGETRTVARTPMYGTEAVREAPAAAKKGSSPPRAKDAKSARKIPASRPIRASSRPPSSLLPDVSSFIRGMRAASDRDRVIDLLLEGVASFSPRAAVFVVKKDRFVGWTCTTEFGDKSALRTLEIGTEAPTVLALSLVLAGNTQLVKLERNDAHAALLAILKATGDEVAVTAIKVETRPALVILSEGFADPQAAIRRTDDLTRAAGEALGRIVREKRKG